jgi:hypothetical protein
MPDVKIFSGDLTDDMRKALEAVCAKLRLAPKTDKATGIVAARIVELAKAGRRGDESLDRSWLCAIRPQAPVSEKLRAPA